MKKLSTALVLAFAFLCSNIVFGEHVPKPVQFPPNSQPLVAQFKNAIPLIDNDRSVGSIILINQFGDGSGSDLTGNGAGCQDFEANYDEYDIAAVDNFSVTSSCKINQIIWGLTVYANCDPSLITGFRINIHDSLASAQTNLIGNYASLYLPANQAHIFLLFDYTYMVFIQELFTNAPLSTLPTLVQGEYWFSLVPVNDYGTNSQTTSSHSTIGVPDAFWTNPGNGFGGGTTGKIGAPLAFALNAIETTTISVPDDYATIQEAVDAATTGSTIEVGPGTYNEEIIIDGLSDITLVSTNGPTRTFIKGDFTGSVVTLGYSSGIIDGFTIQNGGGAYGGGLSAWEAEFDIENCTITNNSVYNDGGGAVVGASTINFQSVSIIGNSALRGGGVLNYASETTFTDCEFINNICGTFGGGFFLHGQDANHLATARIIRTDFIGNTADISGGAISSTGTNITPAYAELFVGISEDDTIEGNGCLFKSNFAYGKGSQVGRGGAIYFKNVAPQRATIAGSLFKNNEAEISGGAICFSYSGLDIKHSRFMNNKAEWSGGGLELDNDTFELSQIIVDGNEAQRGAGIICNYGGTINIESSVIASNKASAIGGGIAMIEGTLDVFNSILWNNSSASGVDMIGQASDSADAMADFARYSVVQGSDGLPWYDNDGNIWPMSNKDPRFLDLLGPDGIGGTGDENYRLLATSPCIDAGSNRFADTENLVDYDFNPRFLDDPYTTDTGDIYDKYGFPLSAVIDIGPYEHVANVAGDPGDKIWNCGSWTTWYVYNNDTCWLPESPMVGDRAILRSGDTGISQSYLTSNMAHDVALVVSDWSFMDLGGYNLDLENDSGAELIVGPYSHSSNYHMTWLEFTDDYLGLGGTVTAEQIEVHGEGRGLLSFHGVTLRTDSINVEFGGRLHLHECAVVKMSSSADPVSISVQGTLDMHFPYWSTVDGNVTFLAEESGASSGQNGRLLVQPIPTDAKLFGWTIISGNVHLGGTLQISTSEMQDSEVGDEIILLEADGGFTDNFDCVVSDGFDDDRFIYITIENSSDGTGQQVVAHIESASNLLGFGDPESAVLAGDPADAELADMDGDGDVDLVISLPGVDQVIILRNGGNDGTTGEWLGFSDGSILTFVDATPLGLALGDIEGDDAIDIVVACRDADTVVVLENISNSGSFSTTSYAVDTHIPPEQNGIEAEPVDVAIGNFDGSNGLNDVAVANSGDSTIIILASSTSRARSVGTGGNSIPMSFGVSTIDPGDTTNPKDLTSILAVSRGGGKVAQVNGVEALRDYSDIQYYDVGNEPEELVVGDLNGDGLVDLATADSGSGTISILIQETDGSYASSVSFAIGDEDEFPRSLALGDYDVDGDLDLAVVVYNSETGDLVVRTMRNDSIGGVILFSQDSDFGDGASLVRSADVNDDSATDVVIISFIGAGLRNMPDCEATTYISSFTLETCPSDINGDSNVDVDDLLLLIGSWGSCTGCDPDINDDGAVDVDDLLLLIGAWGPC